MGTSGKRFLAFLVVLLLGAVIAAPSYYLFSRPKAKSQSISSIKIDPNVVGDTFASYYNTAQMQNGYSDRIVSVNCGPSSKIKNGFSCILQIANPTAGDYECYVTNLIWKGSSINPPFTEISHNACPTP